MSSTVRELMWEDAGKYVALTDEQRRAQFQGRLERGVEKLRREKRQAKRASSRGTVD